MQIQIDQSRIDGRSTSVPAAERFWSCVDRSGNGCWEWRGRRDENGYGRTSVGGRRNHGTHRVAWELTHGSTKLCVLHRCDNPPCCNPDHLFVGTKRDNAIDRQAKGRSKNLDRGDLHPKAKLTAPEVAEMRALRASGWTQIALAQRFGISRGNVSKIVNGRSY
jgi:hypothetical protein